MQFWNWLQIEVEAQYQDLEENNLLLSKGRSHLYIYRPYVIAQKILSNLQAVIYLQILPVRLDSNQA